MKVMKDYQDLYLKCNVLLLVDFCEKIRNNSIKKYGLCPSHYLRARIWSNTWYEKNGTPTFPDPDLYIIFEKCMRGAVSYISNRNSKNQSILYSLTQISYMVVRCLSFFEQVDSNG